MFGFWKAVQSFKEEFGRKRKKNGIWFKLRKSRMLRPLATVAPSVGHPVLFSAIQRGPVTSRSEQNVSSCRLVFFILVVFILFYKRIFFRPDDWSSNLLIEFMAEPAASPECRRKLSANIVNAVVTYGPCLVWWPSHWLRPVDARSWPSFLASTKNKKK